MSDNMPDDEMQICRLLNEWADATRTGRLDDILSGYRKDAVIYDVLAPMQYLGTEAYRRSWGDWQPETRAEGLFALEDLRVEAGSNAAFVFGFLRCGGTMPDGQTFEDLVRATFCLTKREGNWQIAHQHISKPIEIPKKS